MIVAIGGVGVNNSAKRRWTIAGPRLWLAVAPHTASQGKPTNAILGPQLRLIEDRRVACLRSNIVKSVEHNLDPAKSIANIGGAATSHFLGFGQNAARFVERDLTEYRSQRRLVVTVESVRQSLIVAIRGITVRGSGQSLIDKNSGIFLDRTADRATVEDVVLLDNLIGVYLDGTHDALVRHSIIHGLHTLRRTERGPSVSIWNAPGSRVLDNELEGGRDGVFSVSSKQNTIRGNRLHGLRFAVHFMYTNESEVADNISVGNDVGYVMMYSDRLRLHDNVSDGDRDNGLLFNYANGSAITGNVVRRSEKCVFIYNANKNRFTDNWFESCSIGVHFTAGSERNTISGNSFVSNRTQVMYVGTRSLDWASEGRGNYWSDNPAFDLNGDGIADTAYRPNDIIDQVVWRAPAAKLLLNSPAVQVVRWAQAHFPAIHPGGVLDSAPLMRPVRPPALSELEPLR